MEALYSNTVQRIL